MAETTTVKTDTSTIIGILFAFTLIAIAISMGGNVYAFVDVKSLIIVVGGTIFLTIACFNVSDFFRSLGTIFKTIFYSTEEPQKAAMLAIEIAEKARKEGILAMQKYEEIVEGNAFFERGVTFLIDGLPYEQIERMMNEEIDSMLIRHQKSINILRRASEISPAMGLIGTLIGLIQMLGSLDNPSTIGPAMAVALLTTLYGAMLAYMVFMPLASKLERISKDEAQIMEIYLLSISSIGRKENPRRLEMLINSVLSPANRVKYFS